MYLKRLSANKENFHTVNFEKDINFIIGKRENPNDKNLKETYNGLGKSLIIEIIHFCFGSDKIDCFEEKLNDWIFYLEFELKGEEFKIERSCSNQNIILLNGELLTKNKFLKRMESLVLENEKKISFLTFRSILSRFIRRRKSSYNKYSSYQEKETDYQKLLNNGYLLGLDSDVIQSKMINKKEIDKLNNSKKAFEKDEVLKEYFTNNEDLDILITDIKEEIIDVQKELDEFKVAENYDDIQKKANELSSRRRDIMNKLILIENSLKKIEKSLEVKADIQANEIMKLYEEAQVIFENKIIKSVNQVNNFHNKLLESRKRNLKNQKQSFLDKKSSLELEKLTLSKELDETMSFLGSHGALDEYKTISEKLSLLKRKLEKANEYKALMENYENKIAEANINFEKQKIDTIKYIKDNEELLQSIMTKFRTFSKVFYKDKPSGIDIKINDKENQIRFDINAKIIGDSSDGISEVSIFCFDLTLVTLKNTNIRFLIHDSRLFANMDPRQRLSLIKIINDEVQKSGIQYIASLNEDLIEAMESITDEENYNECKKLINDKTRLVLTDKSDKNKLLGITVDLPYDN